MLFTGKRIKHRREKQPLMSACLLSCGIYKELFGWRCWSGTVQRHRLKRPKLQRVRLTEEFLWNGCTGFILKRLHLCQLYNSLSCWIWPTKIHNFNKPHLCQQHTDLLLNTSISVMTLCLKLLELSLFLYNLRICIWFICNSFHLYLKNLSESKWLLITFIISVGHLGKPQ